MSPRYCGQAVRLTAYSREQPFNYARWARCKDTILEHRTTCIVCNGRLSPWPR